MTVQPPQKKKTEMSINTKTSKPMNRVAGEQEETEWNKTQTERIIR